VKENYAKAGAIAWPAATLNASWRLAPGAVANLAGLGLSLAG